MIASAKSPGPRGWLRQLWAQVLIAMLLGVALGHYYGPSSFCVELDSLNS